MPTINLTTKDHAELYDVYTTTLNADLRIRCQIILLDQKDYNQTTIEDITFYSREIITECFRRYEERRLVGLQSLSRPLPSFEIDEEEGSVSDTYHYQVLLGASNQRLIDSQILLEGQRYKGAIYVGCYAIECILKCYLCHREGKRNFLDTRVADQFRGIRGHSLRSLLTEAGHNLERVRKTDRNGELSGAIKTIFELEQHIEYRYNRDNGNLKQATDTVNAIKKVHKHFLQRIS